MFAMLVVGSALVSCHAVIFSFKPDRRTTPHSVRYEITGTGHAVVFPYGEAIGVESLPWYRELTYPMKIGTEQVLRLTAAALDGSRIDGCTIRIDGDIAVSMNSIDNHHSVECRYSMHIN